MLGNFALFLFRFFFLSCDVESDTIDKKQETERKRLDNCNAKTC